MHLALHDQRVDLLAAVVHRHVADQVDPARLPVDLDHGHVGAERKGEVGRVPGDAGFERGLQAVGEVVGREGLEGDRRQRHGALGRAAHREGAARQLEVLLGHLELVGGDGAGLGENPLGGEEDRRAPHAHGPGPVRVHPVRRHRGVGMQHLHLVGADPELVGHDHRPARHVPLAVGRGARHDLGRAGRQDPDRRRLPPAGGVVERREDPAGGEAAHLHVRRQPHPEVTGRAPGPTGALLFR